MPTIPCTKCYAKGTIMMKDDFKRIACDKCNGTCEIDSNTFIKSKQKQKQRKYIKKFEGIEEARSVDGV